MRQPLLLEIVARRQLRRLAVRSLIRQPRDHAQVVKLLVRLRLQLRLAVILRHRRRARLLVHQVAVELHPQALVLRLRRLQLQVGIDRRLLHLRIAHLQQNRVRLHRRTRQHQDAHHRRLRLCRNLPHILLARDQRPQPTHLPQHRPALHRVRVHRASLHRRRRRFQPRHPNENPHRHDQQQGADRHLLPPLLLLELRTRDIHATFLLATALPKSQNASTPASLSNSVRAIRPAAVPSWTPLSISGQPHRIPATVLRPVTIVGSAAGGSFLEISRPLTPHPSPRPLPFRAAASPQAHLRTPASATCGRKAASPVAPRKPSTGLPTAPRSATSCQDDSGEKGELWYIDTATGKPAVLVTAERLAGLEPPGADKEHYRGAGAPRPLQGRRLPMGARLQTPALRFQGPALVLPPRHQHRHPAHLLRRSHAGPQVLRRRSLPLLPQKPPALCPRHRRRQ